MPANLLKKTGTGAAETATPAEVAEVYEFNDDTNKFTDAEKSKLEQCKPITVTTQDAFDAIPAKITDSIYFIRPEV